jgi:TPR repeat protein
MKHFLLSCATAIALFPATSWAQDDAETAYASRDFATAKTLWQKEAADGSAEAMLGLGLLADRGFGQQRDFDVAFDWYMQAANLGLAEAQFNVAIMLDAGLGRARDVQEAQIWYTRAALRDHARAQYNLGLLYEAGDGIAANPALAAYWFDKAALTVPAAAQKNVAQIPASPSLKSPEVKFAEVGTSQVEFVWNADPSASGSHLVEVIAAPNARENYQAPALSLTTVASGILEPSTLSADAAVWRVVNIADDVSDYAASDWAGTLSTATPLGRITLIYDSTVPSMQIAAEIFARDLRDAGYWLQLNETIPETSERVYVSYGFASDQPLAEAVASLLPSTEEIIPAKQRLGTTQPGEIVIDLTAFR